MKVALLTKKKKFEIDDQKIIKKLKNDEVLVKITGTGICGSDLHFFRNGALGTSNTNFPLSLGHETAGLIIDKNKSKFKNYTNVVIDPLDVSKCTSNYHSLICNCNLKKNLCKKQTYLGSFPTPGSFREYMVLKINQITKVNKKINPKIASMIEPAGIAQYSIDRAQINKEKDNNFLVLGAGAIGLLICSLLKSIGFKNITLIDKNIDRLNLGKKFFGANKIINTDVNSKKLKILNEYNFIFDLITTNGSFDYGVKSASRGAKYIIVGIPEEYDFLTFNPHKSRIKEIDFLNVRRSNVSFEKMQNIIIKKNIPINKLVTHSFKLEDIQKGFNIASEYQDSIIRGVVY